MLRDRTAMLAHCDAERCLATQQVIVDHGGTRAVAEELRRLGWLVTDRDRRGLVLTFCPEHPQ
jgi:hypothetical protein